jgi:hypothetical protein
MVPVLSVVFVGFEITVLTRLQVSAVLSCCGAEQAEAERRSPAASRVVVRKKEDVRYLDRKHCSPKLGTEGNPLGKPE